VLVGLERLGPPGRAIHIGTFRTSIDVRVESAKRISGPLAVLTPLGQELQ